MFPRIFFCRQRGGITSVGSDREASIAWTRVHVIINQHTCAKSDLSEIDLPLTWRHVDASGASDLHRTYDSEGTTLSLVDSSGAHDRGDLHQRTTIGRLD